MQPNVNALIGESERERDMEDLGPTPPTPSQSGLIRIPRGAACCGNEWPAHPACEDERKSRLLVINLCYRNHR